MWRAQAPLVLSLVAACRFDAAGMGESTIDSASPLDTATSVVQLPALSRPDADAEASIECGEPGAVLANGHCYFALDVAADWYVSRDACAAQSSHLVTVVDAAEHALVKSLATGDRWLGLRKVGDAGVFGWITGEPFAFDAFAPGEPNGTGSCGKTAPDGEWRDYSCLDALPAICERE